MSPRSAASKSRSKKGKQPLAKHEKNNQAKDITSEDQLEVTQDGEQEGETVAGDSVQETSHLSSGEIGFAIGEVVGQSGESEEPPTETAPQAMTMDERADRLKALRLKMVGSVSDHKFSH